MFNMFSFSKVLKGRCDWSNRACAADKQVDGVSFRDVVDQILSAFRFLGGVGL
jgi:hypothetical protein